MTRQNYAAVVEQMVKTAGRPYVCVGEARKAIFAGANTPSFDFLIYQPEGDHLLVWVLPRSRSKPTGTERKALADWEKIFGTGFAGMFVHVNAKLTAEGWDTSTVTAWMQADDPSTAKPLAEFLKPAYVAAPADPPPTPVSVNGQMVFDAGCVRAGVQFSMF